MNEDRKKRGLANGKFFTAVAICALFLGSGNVMAAQTASDDSQGVQEQMQSISVTVTVVDTKGEPIIGANVIEKGTTNGGITDLDGVSKLNVKPGAILQVSFVGYTTQEVKATSVMKVVLKDDTELLDEVVVVGYGAQKKVNLTGAVASVDVNKTIDSRPITDIGRALQGAVPGLTITTNSGEIGGAPTIKIRGSIGSPNGDSKPLILVDNVEVTDISMVNPDDIESISVLKDAASASIYGARGAFGVLLITTKSRSKHERLSVKYTNNFAWRTPTKTPEQLPGWQQADINLQGVINQTKGSTAFYNVVGNMRVDATHVQKMKDYWDKYGYGDQFGREMELGRDFEFRDGGMFFIRTWDWYDEYIKDWAPQQNHSLSINGGNGKTNYNIALGYLSQDGMMKVNSDNYKRYNANISLNSELNQYVSIRTGVMFTRSDYDKPFNYNSDLYDPMYYLYRWQPMMPYGTFEGKEFRNALTEQKSAPITTKEREYLRLTGGATIKPIKDLTLDIDVAYSSVENRYKKYGTPSLTSGYEIFTARPSVEALRDSYGSYLSAATYDYVYQETGRTENLTANFVATYAKRWGDHDFKAMAGSSLEKSEYEYYWAQRKGLLDPAKPELNLATGDQTTSSSHTWWSVAGFFGRLNYSYKDRYMLELNGRYDGSSRFSPENRWGIFPSFSAGWRLSEEKFMKKMNWLDNLKLRVSWGQLGNNSIGNYEWQAVYATAPHYAFGNKEVPGLGMGSFSNYNLEWETTTVTNLGIDFSMLKNRLSGTVEVYNKLTDGILYNPTLSPTLSGFSSPRQNIAEVTNKGLEITLGWNDRIGSVSYGISGNFSYNKNEVTKYKGELVRGWQQNADGSSTYYTNLGEVSTGDLQRVLEGHMINEFYVLNVYKGNRNYFNADGTVNPKGGPSDGMIRTEDDMKWLQAMTDAGYKFYPKQGIGKSNIWYGDIIYADLDGDGIYGDDDDKDFQGYSKTPKYYFGFQTNLSWKGIDFSMNWAGAAGFKINWYQSGENSSITWFGYGMGKDVAYDHYFYDPENPNDPRTNLTSANPRLTMDKAAQVSVSGQHILHNGNYLKLKNLTVGYTLPKDWVQKVCMQNVRVYVSGENLLTITKFKGIDPEMMSGVGYAPMRQYAFGVNVTF